MPTAPVIVVGAGAAGLVAAQFAASTGAPTVLLESTHKLGAKILISGGGRCNVLPGEFEEQAFYTQGSRNVLRRIFKTWPHAEVRAWFEQELGVALKFEADSGKLFPVANRAAVVRDALQQANLDAGVELCTGFRVTTIDSIASSDSEPSAARFLLRSDAPGSAPLEASSVILATGGKSVPKTGSDGHGYALAQRFGHSILPTYPALVPLRHAEQDLLDLAGITLPIAWSTWLGGKRLDSGIRSALFTHQGMSGPAILDASRWIEREAASLHIGWGGLDMDDWRASLQNTRATHVGAWLNETLPKRLTAVLLARAEVADSQQLAQLSKPMRGRLIQVLGDFVLPTTGSRGYAVAEVTGGGIPLNEVSPSSLESRTHPGLYLCGEILDCIGRIGGHNFLWAWVTAKLAGTQAAHAVMARAASE
jgi:predicted Rossmann fold flavoprotein